MDALPDRSARSGGGGEVEGCGGQRQDAPSCLSLVGESSLGIRLVHVFLAAHARSQRVTIKSFDAKLFNFFWQPTEECIARWKRSARLKSRKGCYGNSNSVSWQS